MGVGIKSGKPLIRDAIPVIGGGSGCGGEIPTCPQVSGMGDRMPRTITVDFNIELRPWQIPNVTWNASKVGGPIDYNVGPGGIVTLEFNPFASTCQYRGSVPFSTVPATVPADWGNMAERNQPPGSFSDGSQINLPSVNGVWDYEVDLHPQSFQTSVIAAGETFLNPPITGCSVRNFKCVSNGEVLIFQGASIEINKNAPTPFQTWPFLFDPGSTKEELVGIDLIQSLNPPVWWSGAGGYDGGGESLTIARNPTIPAPPGYTCPTTCSGPWMPYGVMASELRFNSAVVLAVT